MAVTSVNNFEGTIKITAPAGGYTRLTLKYNTTTKTLVLPTDTVASGSEAVVHLSGKRINGAPKLSGTAWVAGQPLVWATGTSQLKFATGTQVNGHAADAATAAATTGDFILSLVTR